MKRPVPKRRSTRKSNGSFLIEFLVSFVLISIISFALLQISSDSLRHLTVSRNDLYASEVMDELFEQTFVLGYAAMKNYAGQSLDLKLNATTVGDEGSKFRKYPLLLDMISKTWKPESISSAALTNSVLKYEVAPVVDDTIVVTFSFSWQDSYGSHLKSQQVKLYKDSV